MLTSKQIIAILEVINSCYPGRFQITDKTAQAWSIALDGISFEAAMTGTYQAIRNNPFPPSPADILANLRQALTLSMPAAADAWMDVQSAIEAGGAERYAAYRQVEDENGRTAMQARKGFECREDAEAYAGASGSVTAYRVAADEDLRGITGKVVATLGGLDAIENADNPDIIRAQFIKAYDAAVARFAADYVGDTKVGAKLLAAVAGEDAAVAAGNRPTRGLASLNDTLRVIANETRQNENTKATRPPAVQG